MTKVLGDGFKTTISFASNPSVKFFEKDVTPPGISGGGANDTTTMRNTAWRTKQPKKLKTLSTAQAMCAYDPDVYTDIVSMINVNQLITITFPDNSTLAFWGWVDEFTPEQIKEGDQPTATVKIECSNQNDAGAEVAPTETPG